MYIIHASVYIIYVPQHYATIECGNIWKTFGKLSRIGGLEIFRRDSNSFVRL